jgi:hypothetical protein
MDETPEFPKENINNLKKDAINKELDAFINPKKNTTPAPATTPLPPEPKPMEMSALGNVADKTTPIAKPKLQVKFLYYYSYFYLNFSKLACS